ncbi:MAG TPA: hypothetical protein GX519_01910 [Thermoanaerobacterales bacterium]|nr:hypothetical protein [Thermoanaerobacterales bacterium]
MKTVIVTQEEPFYIPLSLTNIIKPSSCNISAIIVLPGVTGGLNIFTSIKNFVMMLGFFDFIAYGLVYTKYKLLDWFDFIFKPDRFYSVKKAAKKNNIPLYYFDDINDKSSINILKKIQPDVIVSIAAPQVFKKEIIGLAKYVINVHGALLPKYQGMMPGFWAMAKGEKEAGVTVHFINEGIDQGDILVQEKHKIAVDETLHSMQRKIAVTGAEAILEALTVLKKGQFDVVHPDLQKGSYFSFPTREAAREFRLRGYRFI